MGSCYGKGGCELLAAIRICPLTATRLTLSLSQSVSGSRYHPPWVCYRLRVRADAAGCGARQAGSMPGAIGALAIASGLYSRFLHARQPRHAQVAALAAQ